MQHAEDRIEGVEPDEDLFGDVSVAPRRQAAVTGATLAQERSRKRAAEASPKR